VRHVQSWCGLLSKRASAPWHSPHGAAPSSSKAWIGLCAETWCAAADNAVRAHAHLADSLRGAGAGWDDVGARAAPAAPVLLAGPIHSLLRGGGGVDSLRKLHRSQLSRRAASAHSATQWRADTASRAHRHERADDAKVLVDDLRVESARINTMHPAHAHRPCHGTVGHPWTPAGAHLGQRRQAVGRAGGV